MKEHNCNNEDCGCDGNHEKHEGCGCGHDHEHEHHHHDTVTLTLEDGSELECPIIDIFDIEEASYIALLHPIDELLLLYGFHDYEDGTIEITKIETDEEFEKVTSYVKENLLSEEADS